MILAPVASPPAHLARGGSQVARGGGQSVRGGGQSVRGRPRGGGHVGQAQPCCYAFLARPKVESSDAVIIGIISVCHIDASVLFDRGYIYSYVSSYFALHLSMPCDFLDVPVSVSMSFGDSLVVDQVYWSCVITINDFDIVVDLLLLNMVDFEVILGMDWLSPYHAILDYHTKTLTLAMLGLPRLE
ncbi:uncharacterized protein [Nicotiana tomentosiformis]|uniref:uncharacterized protein n=1 Tax=Nicotiana tomentosiformis TaxID=4098 RepID=UPI00388C8D25